MIKYKGFEIPTWAEVKKMYDTKAPTDIMLKSVNYIVPIFGEKKVYHIDTQIRKGDLDQYNTKHMSERIYESAVSFIDDLINKNKSSEKENKKNDKGNKKSNFRGQI